MDRDEKMLLQQMVNLATKLVSLAQERNTYALEGVSEQRISNTKLREIEQELDEQTDLLKKLAAKRMLKRTANVYSRGVPKDRICLVSVFCNPTALKSFDSARSGLELMTNDGTVLAGISCGMRKTLSL
jgi:ABC-type Na+ transport system ATPase subunit NatA